MIEPRRPREANKQTTTSDDTNREHRRYARSKTKAPPSKDHQRVDVSATSTRQTTQLPTDIEMSGAAFASKPACEQAKTPSGTKGQGNRRRNPKRTLRRNPRRNLKRSSPVIAALPA